MRIFPSTALLLGLLGCLEGAAYNGDGVLSDRGPRAATDRYILDLGQLDFARHQYRLADLPSTEFVIGIQVAGLSANEARSEAERLGPILEIWLTTSAGAHVFHEISPLAEWVWTCGVSCENAFAYRRGKEVEVTQREGVHEMTRETGADGGWGSYFRPRPGESYRLEISMSGAAELLDRYEVRLLATGGGWK